MMHSQNLLPSNPLSLYQQLRRRTDKLRSKMVRANCNAQFAQTAPELAEFRRATATFIDEMDDDALSGVFQKTVQFTAYDSYAALIARFSDEPCKASAVVNLLAPGLPDYLAESSSTSGGRPKKFPLYNCLSKVRSSDTGSWPTSDALGRRTAANIWFLWCHEMNIENEDDSVAGKIRLACGTVVHRRTDLNLDPDKDRERMGTFIFDHTAPYATGFIKKWRPFLLIHALFAVASRSLETMSMVFISTFVDMMRHLDVDFDMIVHCIENGVIPDLEGVEEIRHYLEPNIAPDPERAEELRKFGRPSSRPSWCNYVWPKLRSITCVAGGSFASSLPLAEWYIGPSTEIHSGRYGSTESLIGLPYNPLEYNLFKPNSSIIIEFLDLGNDNSISALAQLWEVETGKQYEIVLTTSDGLWRYRLGDVVEIAGFDPTDGVPIIQFIERRNVTMRFPDFMVTEKDLRAAMSSLPQNMLANIVNWTATIDNRHAPATIGFFVELANDQVSDFARGAPNHLLDALLELNGNITWALAHTSFRKPTIWIVRPGTFSDFRQLKLDEGCNSLGQVKVPVVVPKDHYVTWFSDRILHEL